MFLVLDFVYIVLYIKIFFNYKVNEKFALLFSLISQNFRKKNVNLYYKLASFFFLMQYAYISYFIYKCFSTFCNRSFPFCYSNDNKKFDRKWEDLKPKRVVQRMICMNEYIFIFLDAKSNKQHHALLTKKGSSTGCLKFFKQKYC